MPPLLDVSQCTVKFGGLTAVSALDLQLGPHDLAGLIGPNGAGKTTVFNIVTGVYQPTSGAIAFAGKPIAGSKPNVIAGRGIARTFQNIRLFATLNVFDNVRAAFNLKSCFVRCANVAASRDSPEYSPVSFFKFHSRFVAGVFSFGSGLPW